MRYIETRQRTLARTDVVIVLNALSASDAKPIGFQPRAQDIGRTFKVRPRIRTGQYAATAKAFLYLRLQSAIKRIADRW